ncbi:MAG: class I SAM-dependent methyltransferase [Erysipelotrichaceae bacterium]|nr:class I SAM-dependent methyltransferase [Erysipelotrichaceae bacterium]
MDKQINKIQSRIHLGTHGENYGTWMSFPVFYMMGGKVFVVLILTILSFKVFHMTVLGIILIIDLIASIAFIGWMEWIRRQYAFGRGGMMEKGHQTMLSLLGYDGNGTLLEVGCGSGPLSIRAALTWPQTKVVGIDYWGKMWDYSKALCEKNAASEGVASQCIFQKGDANKLDFADESFDAVISNYVYHNIMGSDVHELIMESLRVLKKGGVFAINDAMKPKLYGDMEAFAQKLRDMGYQEVQLVNMSELVFESESRAAMMMLGNSRMLIGRK